jgi:hypothetical protein
LSFLKLSLLEQMRSLIAFFILLSVAASVWFLLPDSEQPDPQRGQPEAPVSQLPDATPERGSSEAVLGEAIAERKRLEDQMEKLRPTDEQRDLWRQLRPIAESQVPDPDGIGPCPPVHLGGHGALVVRRYREPGTGHLIWVHADRARTIIQPGMFKKDPETGEQYPTTALVTTQVPSAPAPMDPSVGKPDEGGGR